MIFLQPYKKYAVFSGRATRLEFWSFFAVGYFIVSPIMFIVSAVAYVKMGRNEVFFENIFLVLFIMTFLIPLIAVSVRRLHDINKPAWWCAINFIPIIGFIWFFAILMCRKGTEGENRFGSNPKQHKDNAIITTTQSVENKKFPTIAALQPLMQTYRDNLKK